jgi:ribonucleases P/MRP protein subunit RPP40
MGPDKIHPAILKNLSEQLAYPLTKLFQKSIVSNLVPSIWKLANVTPIFKKGKKSLMENYRPISLTSQLCRIFEKIIKFHILDHIIPNELQPSQHGFLQNKSCLTNLLLFLEQVTEDVDEGFPIDVIYLDFKKAFDKVPHNKLIEKMKANKINPSIIKWVKNWLTGRKQRVVVRGTRSNWLPVASGVPQGSVLGPILFLIYINDLENGIGSKVLKFADDTKIFKSIKSSADSKDLQNDLNKISSWSKKWQMPFNANKCHSLHIGHNNPKPEYYLSGEKIQSTNIERDLGVLIQDDLDQSQQVAKVVKKANQMLGLISRTYTNKSRDNIIPLYKTLVRPHLEFAVQAWRPYKQKDIDNIESVQRRATRMVSELTDMDYPSRLKNTNLISLEMRRLRADLIEVFKIMKGFEGVNIDDFFVLQPTNKTRGHPYKIAKKYARLDVRKYFFSNRVVNEWNNLSEEIVNSSSINEFKSKIQKYFEDNRSSYISLKQLSAPVLKIS